MIDLDIAAKIASLREQEHAFAQQDEVAQTQRQKRIIASHQDRIPKFIKDVYDKVETHIDGSCSYFDGEEFSFFSNNYSSMQSPQQQEALRQFTGQTRLKITPTDHDHVNLTITLSDQAHSCTVSYTNGLKGTVSYWLDFATLIAEGKRRAELWRTILPELVEQYITDIKDCLQNKSDKIYGFDAITSVKPDFGHSPFNSTIQLSDDIAVQCTALSEQQISQLETAINSFISGGNIKLMINRRGIEAQIQRDPEKLVPNPRFDYEAFCQTYDAVTPELQKVFDTITRKLTAISAEAQILTLQPRRLLSCDLSSSQIVTALQKPFFQQEFIATVERAYPTIKITSINFDSPGYPPPPRVNLQYQLIGEAPSCLAGQAQTEQIISHIKTNYIPVFARQLTERILQRVDELRLETIRRNYSAWRELPSTALEFDITGKISESTFQHQVDLNLVDDTNFLEKIQQSILDLTESVVECNIAHYEFRLNL